MVFTVTVCSFHLAFHVVAVWDHQDDIFKNYKVAVKTEKNWHADMMTPLTFSDSSQFKHFWKWWHCDANTLTGWRHKEKLLAAFNTAGERDVKLWI